MSACSGLQQLLLRLDSVRSRQDFPRHVEQVFTESECHVSRALDHLFLFLHCLMLESGFQSDDPEQIWSKGGWKPCPGNSEEKPRSCYATSYKVEHMPQVQITLRMTPVGSTLMVLGS